MPIDLGIGIFAVLLDIIENVLKILEGLDSAAVLAYLLNGDDIPFFVFQRPADVCADWLMNS